MNRGLFRKRLRQFPRVNLLFVFNGLGVWRVDIHLFNFTACLRKGLEEGKVMAHFSFKNFTVDGSAAS